MSTGASFSLKTLNVPDLIMSLWGGLYLWEIVQSMPLDWEIITGKRGCLWGALLFYFPFRVFAAVSFATGILAAYPLTPTQSEAVGYIEQSTNLLARVIVFHILTIRISQIWKQRIVSYALFASIVSLEVLSLYGISRIRGVWFGTVMPSALAIFFLCLANVFLLITIVGLHRARSLGNFSPPGDPHRYEAKPLWHVIYKEKAYFIIVIWITQNVSSFAWLCGLKGTDAMTVVGITNSLTIIICGSRIFQGILNKGSVCPMDHVPSVLATVIHSPCVGRASVDAPPGALRRWQKRRARRSAPAGSSVHDGRISIQLPEAHKDVIELQTFASDALGPSTSRVSFKTVQSCTPSSSSDIRTCKRTPSPLPLPLT